MVISYSNVSLEVTLPITSASWVLYQEYYLALTWFQAPCLAEAARVSKQLIVAFLSVIRSSLWEESGKCNLPQLSAFSVTLSQPQWHFNAQVLPLLACDSLFWLWATTSPWTKIAWPSKGHSHISSLPSPFSWQHRNEAPSLCFTNHLELA